MKTRASIKKDPRPLRKVKKLRRDFLPRHVSRLISIAVESRSTITTNRHSSGRIYDGFVGRQRTPVAGKDVDRMLYFLALSRRLLGADFLPAARE